MYSRHGAQSIKSRDNLAFYLLRQGLGEKLERKKICKRINGS
jgi:hypothetical protein